MNKRIRELRHALSLSQLEFAHNIGLKQNAISCMEKDGATITEQTIKIICFQFGVNEHWLRTGNGKMFLEKDIKQKIFFEIFDQLSPILQDYMIKVAKELLLAQSKMQSQDNTDNECEKSGAFHQK